MNHSALSDAADAAIAHAGGPVALARVINEQGGRTITSQAISVWKRIPSDRVLQVEKATGIPRPRLRPDLYPEA